nr:hypothetical protein [Tessaracoccus timonensis]
MNTEAPAMLVPMNNIPVMSSASAVLWSFHLDLFPMMIPNLH